MFDELPIFWLSIIAAVLLVLFILWTWMRRRRGKLQTINWETMGLSRMSRLSKPLGSRLNQRQREQLIWEAMGSGNLDMMLRSLDIPGYTRERHYILGSIVSVTYGMRDTDSQMRALCEQVAWKHIEEFPRLARALKINGQMTAGKGELPRVNTFQYLATLLMEKGDYGKAVEVCKKAIAFGLSDGTKSGYEGRIKRIFRAQDREKNERQSVS